MTTEHVVKQNEVSCRIISLVFRYVESLGYDTKSLAEGLPPPYSREYLNNTDNWVTYEISHHIYERAAVIIGDNAIMTNLGMRILDFKPLSGFESLINKITSPGTAYKLLPSYSRLFNATIAIKTRLARNNTAIVEISSASPSHALSKEGCDFIKGVLTALPGIWELPPAELHPLHCIHQPMPDIAAGSGKNTSSCIFEIHWQKPPSLRLRLKDNFTKKILPAQLKFDTLEQHLKSIDMKNNELMERNHQLAVVREIAINVDKVRTIDEAMTLTVEMAREINGIRMVFVQKMDDAHEYVITPYFSKLRPDTQKMADAIRHIGFDLDKILGTPSNNLLTFPVSKLKVALEYNKNPRLMIIPTMAELLSGIWPKAICDGIQKIVGIKNCIIVPLMVEGKSWGHMLFLVDKEVPIDILEMIGGHCAQAIKNIISMDSLETRNRELLALNHIANITSKSLDQKTQIDSALKEIKQIFNAESAALYLIDYGGHSLRLERQFGMHEAMIKRLETVRFDEVPLGRFFTSQETTISGTVNALIHNLAAYKNLLDGKLPVQFLTAIVRSGSIRRGLLTITRRSLNPFLENDHSLLLSISTQLALSLDNSQLHADVTKRAEEAEAARANLEQLFRRNKLTEEQLRESEERYRTMFEAANDILIFIDSNGKITDVNARIKDIGGYDPSEFIDSDFRSLGRILTPESLSVLEENYRKRLSGIEVPYYDLEMKTSSGIARIIQVSAIAVRKGGIIKGDLDILRDVTELRQAEKELKSQKDLIDRVLATIANAVLLLDKDMKAVMVNQSLLSLFNVEKSAVIGHHPSEIPDFVCFHEAVKETRAGKREMTSREIRYSSGSTEKILVVNIYPMVDENLLMVFDDVTEEYQKQERLYLTDRLASIGEMASGVAHELNNPLTSIINLSSLLKKLDIPEDAKEDLDSINQEAKRCAEIVKNLLAFARKHHLKKDAVQIENVIKDVLKLRSYEHRGKNIKVETVFPPDIPEVLADYFQMQQVFLNIIINAEASMTEAHGQGNLKIVVESKKDCVLISFTDDGPGIRKENMGLIFNPFFTTKDVGKGTGLGLSIVYGIVTSYGGRVYAQSEYGHGATFTVELPVFTGSKGDLW